MTAAVLPLPTAQEPVPEADPAADRFRWGNRFATLGAEFFTELKAAPLPAPYWVATSVDCAEALGLPHDWVQRADLDALNVFSGNALWSGCSGPTWTR